MEQEEIKLRRLYGQHLICTTDSQSVVKDLCGVQSQFLRHALHGLRIRSTHLCMDGLLKSWTVRGTMHIFSTDDLPLFLHDGRNHFLRSVDTLDADAYVTKSRKQYFADLIIDSVSHGIDDRERLKAACVEKGMTEGESRSLFDPWGGVIRALCETGRLTHKVQEKKAYMLCPAFEPMEREAAELEMARRYFTNFGPVTVKDAAYFFGTTQTKVKAWLEKLPVRSTQLNGKTYFYIDTPFPGAEMPQCLFLDGFDQLMLGYDKKESLFLPQEHMRDIFNLAGIVRPTILINGTVAGWWNMKNNKMTLSLFDKNRSLTLEEFVRQTWPSVGTITFA